MQVYFLLSIFSLAIGSFLNACIHRLPRGISLLNPPRSFCPECSETIRWWQNMPIFSYLLLKGRCYFCNTPISWQYPAVELGSVFIVLWFYQQFGFSAYFFFYAPLFLGLLALSIIDAYFRRILNSILLFLLSYGILVNWYLNLLPWEEAIIAVLLSMLPLMLARYLGNLLLKKESMGMGDIKLAGLLGFYLGWPSFYLLLFLAASIALLFYFFTKIILRKPISSQLPFAPFLSLGAFAVAAFPDFWPLFFQLVTVS